MCEHQWTQIDALTRVCSVCSATDVDMEPSKTWVTPIQASRLGFDYRDPTTGLLVLTRTGFINELPV